MNLIEAMQMTRIDAMDDGYRRGIEDACKAIRLNRDDFACGEDMGKIYNMILSAAEGRVRGLLTPGEPSAWSDWVAEQDRPHT